MKKSRVINKQYGFPKKGDLWLWRNFWKHWAVYFVSMRPGEFLFEVVFLIFRFRLLVSEIVKWNLSDRSGFREDTYTGHYFVVVEFYTIRHLFWLNINLPLGKWRKERVIPFNPRAL